MSDLKFKTGDVVSLKSGGPPLTVFLIEVDQSHRLYTVVWFNSEKEVLRDSFSEDEIELASPEAVKVAKDDFLFADYSSINQTVNKDAEIERLRELLMKAGEELRRLERYRRMLHG